MGSLSISSSLPNAPANTTNGPIVPATPMGSLRLPAEHSLVAWTQLRERSISQLPDDKVAMLVRYRLQLLRSQTWGLMALFGLSFASVLPLLGLVPSATVLAIIAAFAPCALGGGALVENAAWRLYRKLAQDLGLDEASTRWLFRRALDAGRWMDILHSVGTPPNDTDVAAFVRQDTVAS